MSTASHSAVRSLFEPLARISPITYLNAKAEPYVRPLAEALQSPIIVPCDVREPGQLEALFARIEKEWGRLDFLLHSIAFAPKEDLHSRITDSSRPALRWRWTSRAIPSFAWLA